MYSYRYERHIKYYGHTNAACSTASVLESNLVSKRSYVFIYYLSIITDIIIFKDNPIDFSVVGGEPKEINVLLHQLKNVQINQNCSFSIETKDNGEGDVKVVIASKIGSKVSLKSLKTC
jgi:hypothetical protein